jgi:hypothetical protein
MGRSDMLEHSDRDDPVEFTLDLAIISQFEFGPIFEPRLAGALLSDDQLLACESYPHDLDFFHLRQRQGEAAPAASDIEHALARLQQELGCDVVFLRMLRLIER